MHHIMLEHFTDVKPGGETWIASGLAFLAFLFNVSLVTLAVALMCGYKPKASADFMGCLIFFWMMFRHLPFVIQNIADPAELNSLCTGLAISGGACAIGESIGLIDLNRRISWHKRYFNIEYVSRSLLGTSIIVIGGQHLGYADFVAAQIPAWIPAKYFLANASGLALIGAGVSMLTGKKIRWGAFCLTIVFGTWIIILHIPGIAARPGNPYEWTALFQAMAIWAAGSAIWRWPKKQVPPSPQTKTSTESTSGIRKYKRYASAREPHAQREH